MADSGWATFGSSSKERETREANEDDWADFGGFESAAIPVTDSSASSGTSGLISWAASFPTTQILSPTSQEKTSTSSQAANDEKTPFNATFLSAAVNASSGQNKMSQSSVPTDPPALDLHIPEKEKNVSEEKSQRTPEQVTSLSLSSLKYQPQQTFNLTTGEDFEEFLNRNMPNSLTGKSQRAPVQVEDQSEKQEELLTPSQPVDDFSLKESQKINAELTDKVELLQEKLSCADREKLRIQQDLENLMEKNERQKHDNEELKELLQKQKEKYSLLQKTHEKQLSEIREAGHEALAVIVEEYKELTQIAVLQQEEKSEAHLQQILEEERKRFQELLEHQQESFEQVLDNERSKNAVTLQEALEQQKKLYTKEIESCLENERKHSEASVLKAVEHCREETVKALSKAVKEEGKRQNEIHEAQKTTFNVMLEEMKADCQQRIECALQQEQENNKDAVLKAVAEERERGKEALSRAVNLTKQELENYRIEKEKSDSVARQKHFLSMDLFLESTRNQLKSLMEENQES